MKLPVATLAVAAAALAACERPANTAYNNSGQTAAVAPGPMGDRTAADPPQNAPTSAARTTTATSDTASPSVAAGAARADDTVTSRRILEAITADSGMRESEVSVRTENGVVTLAGTAKSRDQVAIATDIARKQEGVARVESRIDLE